MERASIDGIQLEYEIHGAGEPVVLMGRAVLAWTVRSASPTTPSTAAV